MNQIDKVIEVLNDAFTRDPLAIRALLVNKVPCNKSLAKHPTIQVGEVPRFENCFEVGTLGIINGIVEALTGERVASLWSDPDDSNRCKLLGFVKY